MSYDYGPPVTQGEQEDQIGVPQDNSEAVDIDNEGETPHTPPPDATTIVEPGGSPSDEIVALYDPSVSSLTPNTAAIGSEATVTVTGTNFTDTSVVEVDQQPVSTTYVSPTELTATLSDPGAAGTAAVTVRNPSAEMESNTTDFTWTAAGNVRTGHIREDSK